MRSWSSRWLSSAESPRVTDTFDGTTIDSKWNTTDIWSGTDDATLAIAETGGSLQIGPLKTNATSSYRGAAFNGTRNFNGTSMSAELVTPPPSTDANAFAMFAVGIDQDQYYRFVVSAGKIWTERRLQTVDKFPTPQQPYAPSAHRYLRIRHDEGLALFETAPEVNGAPAPSRSVPASTRSSGSATTEATFGSTQRLPLAISPAAGLLSDRPWPPSSR
ncbi:MAG TPA: hypothetical protein VK886_07540 [Vicinamibacterales bacterium]|nr:hypothetical protein [Vicinamibacterales bacterium]